MNWQSYKPGRPSNEPVRASQRIIFRISPRRKQAYLKAAGDLPLASWVFMHLDKAAKYKPQRYGDPEDTTND